MGEAPRNEGVVLPGALPIHALHAGADAKPSLLNVSVEIIHLLTFAAILQLNYL